MSYTLQRRRFMQSTLAGLAVAGPGLALASDKFPAHSLRVIVGLPPGGTADASMRVLGSTLQSILGQNIVVDNKPGGNFVLAVQALMQAPADGYTLIHVINAMLSGQAVQKRFDMFKSLTPVARIGSTDITLAVGGNSPHKTIHELIAWAKKNPGKMTYASPGIGSLEHLALHTLCQRSGIEAVHVPYKGGPEMAQAVYTGEADLCTNAVPLILQFAPKGMVRALVVLNDKRSSVLPDVPSLKDVGLDIPRVVLWGGLAVRSGTPQPVVDVLEKAVLAAVANPELRQQYTSMGLQPQSAGATAFAQEWKDDWVWISKAVRDAKLENN